MTSPLPEMIREVAWSATTSSASRRRSIRSVRQSLASSTAARVRLPLCFSSLAFEALEQREGVGGAAGETGEHLVLIEAANLAGIALHDGIAQRNLTVAADHHAAVTAHREDGGSAKLFHHHDSRIEGVKLYTMQPLQRLSALQSDCGLDDFLARGCALS